MRVPLIFGLCRGNLTDTSGNLVARLLPTADTGIISNSGVFFPEAVLPLIWTADNKFAHFRAQGVGCVFLPSSTCARER